MTASVSSLAYALKTLWPQDRVYNEVYPDHPFLAMVPKDENFVGDSMYIVVRTGDPQGRSANFTTAQTISQLTGSGNAGATRGTRFNLTRASDYQLINLTTEVIMASRSNVGSLVKALDTETKAGINNISKSLATALFRGRTGQLARIGSITANSTTSADVVLANIDDVTSFEVKMLIVASATSTGANRSTPASAYIEAVDRDTGSIRLTGDFSSTNWSASSGGDFLFAAGDNADGSGSGNKVLGLADWIPSSTPTSSDSFLGSSRFSDPTRLAGIRVDGSALEPEEVLILTLSRQGREGARPSDMITNFKDYRNVVNALGAKVESEYQTVGDIGFQTIKVMGPKGDVRLYADQDCPSGTLYSLDMRTWKLYSLGACPQILDMDGAQLSRVYNADQFEGRIVYYANLACEAPGFNAVVTMPGS